MEDCKPKKVCKYCKSIIDKDVKKCPNCKHEFGLETWQIVTITLTCSIIPVIIMCILWYSFFRGIFGYIFTESKKLPSYLDEYYENHYDDDNNYNFNDDIILSKGYHSVGTTIEAGTYDIIAISGKGTFNRYRYGEEQQILQHKMSSGNEYNDIELLDDDYILITGTLELKLIKK